MSVAHLPIFKSLGRVVEFEALDAGEMDALVASIHASLDDVEEERVG